MTILVLERIFCIEQQFFFIEIFYFLRVLVLPSVVSCRGTCRAEPRQEKIEEEIVIVGQGSCDRRGQDLRSHFSRLALLGAVPWR